MAAAAPDDGSDDALSTSSDDTREREARENEELTERVFHEVSRLVHWLSAENLPTTSEDADEAVHQMLRHLYDRSIASLRSISLQPMNEEFAWSHHYMFNSFRARHRMREVRPPTFELSVDMPYMFMPVFMYTDAIPAIGQRVPLVLTTVKEHSAAEAAVEAGQYIIGFPSKLYPQENAPRTDKKFGVVLKVENISTVCDDNHMCIIATTVARCVSYDREERIRFRNPNHPALTITVYIQADRIAPPLCSSVVPSSALTMPLLDRIDVASQYSSVPYPLALKYSTEGNAEKVRNFLDEYMSTAFDEGAVESVYEESFVEFSHFCIKNIPFHLDLKLQLLEENSVDLRFELMARELPETPCLSCAYCKTPIADLSSLKRFVRKRLSHHFVNPGGVIHEIITLSGVYPAGTYATGGMQFECSWFENYRWEVLLCQQCDRHIGWFFQSSHNSPATFYGLTRYSIALCDANASVEALDHNLII